MAELDYRRHIDGLRAVAVLAVVAYHAGVPWTQGGFVGVDVFFVISGFLITGLLFREFATTGDIGLTGFYERRIRRLAPALLLVLAVTLALGTVLLVPVGGEQQGLAKSAIATVLLVSNFHFAHATGGYFDAPAAAQPLLHTWSLSVEEQFYLVWPGLMLVMGRWSRRRGIGFDRTLGGLLVLVFVASLALSIVTTATHREFAFFGSPTRAWEFAAGGLVYVWATTRKTPILFAQPIAALGLLAVLYAVVMFDAEALPFPGWHAAIPALGTAALILGCEQARHGVVARLLGFGPLVAIGLVSYAFYLWHWPLLVVARLHTLGEIGPAGIASVCALALILAALTYRFVENPVRRKQVALMRTRASAFKTGLAGSFTILLLAGGLGVWAKTIWPLDPANVLRRDALSNLMTPKLPNCVQPRPYSGKLVDRAECTLPSQQIDPDLVVWGDSHAFHLANLVSSYASTHGRHALIRFMAGCPPMLSYVPEPQIMMRADAVGCRQYNDAVLAEIMVLKAGGLRTVILAARWPQYFEEDTYEKSDAVEAIAKSVDALSKAGLNVVLVAPVPTFPSRVPQCLARRQLAECGVERGVADTYRFKALAVLVRVANLHHVSVLDPFKSLCNEKECPAIKDGVVVSFDDNHLSSAGSLLLMPLLNEVTTREKSTAEDRNHLPVVESLRAVDGFSDVPSNHAAQAQGSTLQ